MSVPYGGRASDRHIVQDSGFLDKISPTDQVMVDRGFPIQSDLVIRQASLIIPPPAQGTEQMTKENVLKAKSVAKLCKTQTHQHQVVDIMLGIFVLHKYLFRTLSSWGSGNYRPSAPLRYEVASH